MFGVYAGPDRKCGKFTHKTKRIFHGLPYPFQTYHWYSRTQLNEEEEQLTELAKELIRYLLIDGFLMGVTKLVGIYFFFFINFQC